MNTSSRRKTLRALLAAALLALLPGCDAQGPWEYYPEEVHVYRGVYTYGYVVKDERPVVCLSKLYALDEAAAESFAFYDSAKVTVSGRFGGAGEKALALAPEAKRPNCFTSDEDATGLAGEEYALEVELLWDSAGHRVRSRYSAKGKVPERFSVKSVTIPLHGGGKEVRENDHSEIPMKVLEFPEDFSVMTAYADFSPDVGGTVIAIRYDSENGGEPTNTTIYNMLKGFLPDRDSLGYSSQISTYSPEETAVELTYQQNSIVAGVSSLDTIMATASMVAVGHNVFLFYATDWNYLDYNETLLRSFDDPRVQPITNVEGGNGVFAGMTRDSLLVEGQADNYVPYSHMRERDCEDDKSDTKFCRLAMESLCVDTLQYNTGSTYLARSSYAEQHYDGRVDFLINCYPSLVTAALRFGYNGDELLPDTNGLWDDHKEVQRKLDSARAKGLRAFCFETDFVSKNKADCSVPEEECRISRERTKCKEEFWQWCADRDWNILDLPQCGSALASRVRLEGLESAVLDRVVEQWCAEHRTDRQCD